MNDQEAQAHQLFATATRDMPPGIDLLDGFAAMRRRDRSRRTIWGTWVPAAIAVAAAGVTAVTLTVGSAPPALATVTSALTSTLAQSYHLSEQSTYYVKGRSNDRLYGTCTTEADPARQMLQSSCSPPNNGIVREVGGYTYYGNSTGTQWQRIPDKDIVQVPAGNLRNSFTGATPQQMLTALKQEHVKVAAAGPASGPGWTGTRYAFSGTVGKITVLSGTMTVDQQGRTRAFVATYRSSDNGALVMTQVSTFSDYGAPVTVTPPPADQTRPFN